LKKTIEAGSLVSPGTAAFVLADTRTIKVVFGVPDTVVPRLKPGMQLPVRTEALPDAEFSGRITRISPSADLKSRVFDVEVTLPNPASRLRAGMIASVVLRGGAAGKKVPVLPLSAIVRSRSKAGEYAVFIVRSEGDKEVARMRDVRLGETFGNAIAVRSGVELGERIITNGSHLVRDGEAVLVVP
jgi:multidrug efflux system membrane fusion protein